MEDVLQDYISSNNAGVPSEVSRSSPGPSSDQGFHHEVIPADLLYLHRVPAGHRGNIHGGGHVDNQGELGICYAEAVSAVICLVARKGPPRGGGYPEFAIVRAMIMVMFGPHGAVLSTVLDHQLPHYGLKYREVGEKDARAAAKRGSPVVASFSLYPSQWSHFRSFYRDKRKGTLSSVPLPTAEDVEKGKGGHAVVLMGEAQDGSLHLLNSWGYGFADGGYFRVQNATATNGMRFYHVY